MVLLWASIPKAFFVFRSTQETEQMQQLDMESDVGEVVNVVNVIPEDQEPTEEQCLGERG